MNLRNFGNAFKCANDTIRHMPIDLDHHDAAHCLFNGITPQDDGVTENNAGLFQSFYMRTYCGA